MARPHLRSAEQALLFQLDAALAGATRIEEVRDHAYPLLSRLVSADIGALCSRREGSGEYDWAGNLPESWFATYPEIAAHDFVRAAVLRSPNIALADGQMLRQRTKERSVLYQRTRHLSLEHALSILLTTSGRIHPEAEDWHGGVTLYRTGRHPFSARETAILQQLAAPFAHALQRCRRTARILDTRSLEAWLARYAGLEVVALDRCRREIGRTTGATTLIGRWFPAARPSGALPDDLVGRCTAHIPLGRTRDFVQRSEETVLLGWVFHRPPGLDGVEWLFVLEERSRRPKAPARWRERLTEQDHRIVELVTHGLSNASIAEELQRSEATVKQHIERAFDMLGVNSRTQLCQRAQEETWRFPPPER